MAASGTKNQALTVWIGTKATNPSGDTFTQIKRAKMVGEFGPEAAVIDATALEDAVKEKLKGIPDSGTIELGGNRVYTDDGQNDLRDAALDTDDDGYNFEIRMTGVGTAGANKKWSFKALVTKFKDNPGQVDGLVEFSASLAVTGAMTEGTWT